VAIHSSAHSMRLLACCPWQVTGALYSRVEPTPAAGEPRLVSYSRPVGPSSSLLYLSVLHVFSGGVVGGDQVCPCCPDSEPRSCTDAAPVCTA
jgi:hypothetical protein